jgi:rubrerythrin
MSQNKRERVEGFATRAEQRAIKAAADAKKAQLENQRYTAEAKTHWSTLRKLEGQAMPGKVEKKSEEATQNQERPSETGRGQKRRAVSPATAAGDSPMIYPWDKKWVGQCPKYFCRACFQQYQDKAQKAAHQEKRACLR